MKRIILLLIFLCSASLVSATYCYQETANISTACGGYATGTYSSLQSGTMKSGPISATYDGDYNTYYASDQYGGYLHVYINYTKPHGALNSSLWQVKGGTEIDCPLTNNTLDINCWEQSPLQLRAVGLGGYNFTGNCYNGSDWIGNYSYVSTSPQHAGLWEEAIWWDIEPIILTLKHKYIGKNPCYQESANVSTSCGGLDTGRYWKMQGPFVADPNNLLVDGNWSTYVQFGGQSNLHINYTKPSNAINAIWQFKTSDGTKNISLPDTCFARTPIEAYVEFEAPLGGDMRFRCLNTTDSIVELGIEEDSLFYEEAMWWDFKINKLKLDYVSDKNNATKEDKLTFKYLLRNII